ncbi:hypothetical protein [Pseudalkalibacillus salsuginis]|uniref:hypothetical protein n=1 Tax=Pseudalkalibacillus salsuginis TaxID=2910972 RepID=UPI001F3C27CC|nr:hypothetical protein [Pseudalkalibacillus salsuginis]MCF6409734.1 hypothetical protein [Pseudalkalibacillus salsuginis]
MNNVKLEGIEVMLTLQPKEEDVLHRIMRFYIYEFSKYIPVIRLEQNGASKPFNLERYS